MPALFDQLPQLSAEGGEVGDFALDLRQVQLRDPIHFGAGLAAVIGQAQQRANLVEGKAQVARPPYEAQSLEMGPGIGAIISAGSRRLGQQADPLIVADSFRLRAGSLGKVPDAEIA